MYPGQVYSSNRCPAPIDTSLTLERALGRLLAVPIKPIAEPRLYQRIAGELARLIDDGTFAPGARLPAERALAKSLHDAVAGRGSRFRTLSVRLPASVLPRRHLNIRP